ncbi:hypothetical protein [Myxacorys almedinensis]|uniref:Uncharacterized protein n=1 Tax=Myxacorys almedinensis A TaxID=2690445 RepID=A0A8J7Z9V7_9CYAN|nr:hypothetical protein [Myxacorys almedinensis]NDJ18075.1 hypothetical protein [Myxacorys almedinensis A]
MSTVSRTKRGKCAIATGKPAILDGQILLFPDISAGILTSIRQRQPLPLTPRKTGTTVYAQIVCSVVTPKKTGATVYAQIVCSVGAETFAL